MSSVAPRLFDVLHQLRIMNLSDADALASHYEDPAVEARLEIVLRELEEQGLVTYREGRRTSSWMLTDEGRARHATELEQARHGVDLERLDHAYAGFLDLNDQVKDQCSTWQDLSPDDADGQQAAVAALDALHERAVVVLEAASQVYPRFGAYERRLSTAVEHLFQGGNEYFTSPLVDSYHTVWFQCHEDFLLMLGRDRAAEGSV